MKKIKVLLLCESGPLGLKVLYCLRGMNAIVKTAGSSGAAMLKYSRYAEQHESVNFWLHGAPHAETQQWLRDIVVTESFDIVVPSDIGSAAFLAATKKVYPEIPCFPCSHLSTLDELHNKWSFAQICVKHDIPIPATILLESADQLNEHIFDKIGFPIIIKPLAAESSHGVVLLDNFQALLAHIAKDSRYTKFPLIAQAFIPGQDIDISILAANNNILCSTVQSWVGDGVLEFTHHSEMYDIASHLVRAFHYQGLAHFDMRIDARDGKLYVIECNPRAWYTISASMWQGLNFIEMGIHYAREEILPEVPARAGEGRYCLAGSLWKQFLSPRTGWHNITSGSFRGFIQALTDPLPHLYSKIR
jgi:predicted ATP-grasp superfamily ATP-dependent carboligase